MKVKMKTLLMGVVELDIVANLYYALIEKIENQQGDKKYKDINILKGFKL